MHEQEVRCSESLKLQELETQVELDWDKPRNQAAPRAVGRAGLQPGLKTVPHHASFLSLGPVSVTFFSHADFIHVMEIG